MKTRFIRLLMLPMLLLASMYMYGQQKTFSLGTTRQLLQNLQQPVSKMIRQQQVTGIQLKVSPTEMFFGKVNFREATGKNEERVIGEIVNTPHASFYINISGNKLFGNIILQNSKKAYKYFSDDNGNAYVEEVDINKVLCIDYMPASQGASNTLKVRGEAPLAIDPNLLKLESFPGARGCILLDFDGQYVSGTQWNNGQPINAAPANLTDAQIQEVWEMVTEDYKPFHVNITTNETVFNTYAKNRRMRVIFTPTNTAAPGAGGVAYLSSFSWNDDTPCWVFNPGVKGAGEAGSHEAGHTVGLSHDGRTNPSEAYFQGHGSWAPIMGVAYTKPIGQWSKGEYANANNTENDLAIITGANFGFGYRDDDYGNTTGTASPLVFESAGNVKTSGIIERTGDIDVFSFSTSGGNISLNFNPAARHPDLDILATLYNSSGGTVTTANPAGLNAAISTNLAAGNYYVSVTGTGAGDARTDGYSNYGSLGVYTITGTIPAGPGNQPPSVSITSPANGTAYTAPATINIQATASDADGTVSKVEFFNGSSSLGTVTAAPYNFTWNNVAAGSYTITAVATDDKGATTTSAVVSVRVTTNGNQPPTVNITSPANNATYTAPASIDIQATAADSDGSIASVEFFNGSTSLAVVSTPPYRYTWSSVPAGDYVLTAKAIDNLGAIATSAAVNIKVNGGGGNCDGVPAYQPYPKIYSQGERAVYNNNLYECLYDGIYNVTPSSAWWWWKLIGPCSGSSAAQLVTEGTDADAKAEKISVYPNPLTGNLLKLQVSGQPGDQLIMEVWNIMGSQLVLRQTQTFGAKGPQVISMDVSKIPAGTWIIKTTNVATGKKGSIKIIRM